MAVRPDDVAAYPLALPPLAEQRAIAAVLDAIDEAIERTEEVIAATERLRDALLHELLTRGLPGRHSEWADVPGLGTVPACWDVVRLGDVCEIASRLLGSSGRRWSDPVPRSDFCALPRYVLTAPRTIQACDAPSRARRRIRSGDILVSTVRPNLRGVVRARDGKHPRT